MKNEPELIKFDNGLTVILHRLDYSKICYVSVNVFSGSAYETEENSGISHFIEHMVFKGTKSRSADDIADRIDRLGGTGNAFTAKDRTCFYLKTTEEHVPEALDILCDMAVNPLFSEKDTVTERGVVEEEIRMYSDYPDDVCAESDDREKWAGSALALPIAGTAEILETIGSRELRQQHGRFYVPERTIINICGGFSKADILKVIDKFYGSRNNTDFPPVTINAEFHPGITAVKKKFTQNNLILSFPGVPNYGKIGITAAVAAAILGDSNSSRLYHKLRDEMGIVYSVNCYNTGLGNAASFCIDAGFSPEDEDGLIKETVGILKNFTATLTDDEVKRTVEQSVIGYSLSYETVSATANGNLMDYLHHGRFIPDEECISEYRKITTESVRELMNSIIDFDKAKLTVCGKVKNEKHYGDLLYGGN